MTFLLLFALLLPPPLVVRINGQVWAIQQVERVNEADDWGYTLCKRRTMLVKKGIPLHEAQRVVVHELLHAASCRGDMPRNDVYNSPRDGEHPGMDLAAATIAKILRDNPRLGEYLSQRR